MLAKINDERSDMKMMKPTVLSVTAMAAMLMSGCAINRNEVPPSIANTSVDMTKPHRTIAHVKASTMGFTFLFIPWVRPNATAAWDNLSERAMPILTSTPSSTYANPVGGKGGFNLGFIGFPRYKASAYIVAFDDPSSPVAAKLVPSPALASSPGQ